VSSNLEIFLSDLRNAESIDLEKSIVLKRTLILDIDFEKYFDVYFKFGILDAITSDLLLKKATDLQVKNILSLNLPIKESVYPLIVFCVLKNYRSLVKELYAFLIKISDRGLKLIINDVLFDSKYFIYLCRLMKNDVRFVSFVIELKKYNEETLSVFAESKEPEVLFRIGNIRHIVSDSDELIKKIMFNPFSPDETITLMKQIIIDKKAAEVFGQVCEDSKEEKSETEINNENTKEAESSLTILNDQIEKEISENLYNKINKMNMAEKIKLALKGNKTARMFLVRDPNKQVSLNVLKNPKITEQEIEFILKNKATGEHLIREIARTNAFIKDYNIMRELVFHPKTPINISMNFINRLFVQDLERLSKSRDVPSSLKNQAQRLYQVKANRK
jgi:hypothetical protein